MKPITYSKQPVFFLIVIIILATCCPSRAQHVPKRMSFEDYTRWGQLRLNQMTSDGAWVSFSMGYDSTKDTLFINQVNGRKSYKMAGARHGFFIGNSHYVFNSDNGLAVMALKDGRIENLGPVSDFEPTSDRKALIYTVPSQGNGVTITIRYLTNNKSFRADGITAYKYCPATNSLAAVRHSGENYTVLHMNAVTGDKVELYHGKGFISGSLAWQKQGRELAFAEHSPDLGDRVISCDILHKHTRHLDLGGSGLIDGEISLVPKGLAYSDDGNSLTFYIRPAAIKKQIDTTGPEIWNADDKELYPARKMDIGWENLPKLALWNIAKGTSAMLTDTVSPQIMMTPDFSHALLWNPLDIEPDHKDSRGQRYTLWNLESKEKKPLLDSPDAWTMYMATSPDGRYLTYFDGRDWIAFEFSSGVRYNLTEKLPVRFSTEKDNRLTEIPFSSPGWDLHGRFIMYDNYDIWIVTPGVPARKITHGREQQLRYRIAPLPDMDRGRSNYNGTRLPAINMDVPLLLELSKSASGYAVLMPGGKISELCAGKDLFSQGALSENGKNLVCLQQNFDSPPMLCHYDCRDGQSLVFKSNTQYGEFGVQHAEKINYTTKKGRQLSGMLYYPLSFDRSKKYPVIVHVYEDQDWQSNWYVNPSLYNSTGFNRSVFTGEGYFVLLPNISYGLDNPGDDAVDCVEAAVKEIALRDYIDPKKLGLIGHSFGGYETNYIIGHSDLFAVAVSGAPINDMASFYHYVVPGVLKPNFFNSENGQFRMSAAYYDQPLKYVEASPLYSVGRIKIPLLSWSGKDDRQIDSFQIKALYLALRRMGNQHVMLIYPGEGHIISDEKNQADLTKKIVDWFGHYLKGLPVPEWAKPDFDK